jgi:CubicO group peptidase (beta-lactamase class C family)
MDPIQDIADRIAAGTIVERVSRSVLLLRDGEAGCDWSAAAGGAVAGETFRADALKHTLVAVATLRAADLSLTGLDKSVANYLPGAVVRSLSTADGTIGGGDLTVRHLLAENPTSAEKRALAGRILEDITGAPLVEVLTEFVIESAGMVSTHLDPSGALTTSAADLASLICSIEDDTLITVDSRAAMVDWQDDPTGTYDQIGLGLGRYLIGGHEAVGYRGFSGDFVFSLPFGVVLAGTVDSAGADPRPIIEATLSALC